MDKDDVPRDETERLVHTMRDHPTFTVNELRGALKYKKGSMDARLAAVRALAKENGIARKFWTVWNSAQNNGTKKNTKGKKRDKEKKNAVVACTKNELVDSLVLEQLSAEPGMSHPEILKAITPKMYKWNITRQDISRSIIRIRKKAKRGKNTKEILERHELMWGGARVLLQVLEARKGALHTRRGKGSVVMFLKDVVSLMHNGRNLEDERKIGRVTRGSITLSYVEGLLKIIQDNLRFLSDRDIKNFIDYTKTNEERLRERGFELKLEE